jgi:DNA polymerase-3 subunit delta
MEIKELQAKIKSHTLSGFYILAGEEDYLKKHYLKEMRESVLSDDGFEIFNHSSFEGASIDYAALREALYAPPMMSEFKLVEWKYASLDSLKAGELKFLSELAEEKDSFPYSVLVILASADGFDVSNPKRSKTYSALSDGFEIITLQKSTDAQLLSWLKKHFDAEGISVDAQTLGALLFKVGHSMQMLKFEVDKLSAFLKENERGTLSLSDIETVCSSNTESGAFALSDAVINKNARGAFLALDDLKSKRTDPTVIIGMLKKTYCDLVSVSLLIDEGKNADDISSILKSHPYKTKLYISSAKKVGTKKLSACLEKLQQIDKSAKSGGISGYTAIEIFITQNL